MLDKYKFFEHARPCPVCSNKLSLYLNISNVGTFKCSNNFTKNKKNKLNFYPLKDDVFGLHAGVQRSDFIKIQVLNDKGFSFTVSSESLFRIIEREDIYFFYLCNLHSITSANNYNNIFNYDIELYKSCYYKSSNVLRFKYDGNKHTLTLDNDYAVSIEAFSFCRYDENQKFCLVYDFNSGETTLYFTNSDNSQDFSKSVQLLDYYPDFSNREKLINKFDSWILLS